jgi:hypothetical protein
MHPLVLWNLIPLKWGSISLLRTITEEEKTLRLLQEGLAHDCEAVMHLISSIASAAESKGGVWRAIGTRLLGPPPPLPRES